MNFFKFSRENILLFVGGAVFSAVVAQVAKSKSCKKVCVSAIAKGMQVKNDVEHQIATIKEEAEDLFNEAKLSQQDETGCCKVTSEE